MARAGIDFELPAKKVHIYGMETLGQISKDTFRIKINCGGGTYIRSLARDIAKDLGTNAVMSALRRTKSGIFEIGQAIPFSLLEEDLPVEELEKYVIPTEKTLPYPTLILQGKKAERFFNGVAVDVDEKDGLYKIYKEEAFYGLAVVQEGKARAKTKLC